MTLQPGAIAGISVAGAVVACVVIWIVYVVIKRRRRNAEYLERCDQLWHKYGRNNEGSEVVAKFPFADPTYVRTPLPGQQFTARELNPESSDNAVLLSKRREEDEKDLERRPFKSIHSSFEPEAGLSVQPSYGTEQGAIQTIKQSSSSDEKEYSPPNHAQVFFSLEYDPKLSVLKIYLDQAKNLKPRDSSMNCDPYCIISILPGEQHKKESQVLSQTTDPLFQENFFFIIPESELKESSIQIMFFAYDQFSQDHCIGVVDQSLEDLKPEKKEEFWRKINPPYKEQKLETAGELLLRLGYQAVAEKLTVVLLKIRSLKEINVDEKTITPDPYIRVAITHDGNLLKKKKTSTKRGTCDPTYNQAINFTIPLHLLPQIEIHFDVVHEDENKTSRAERKNIIGSLEVSPHSSGEEKEHWKDLMSNKPLARWHRLVVKQSDSIIDAKVPQRLNTISETEGTTDVS